MKIKCIGLLGLAGLALVLTGCSNIKGTYNCKGGIFLQSITLESGDKATVTGNVFGSIQQKPGTYTVDGNTVTIIDENVEAIDFSRCEKADIVGVTGMIVQRRRMREILTELRKRNCYTVVGGPWVSVSESYFDNLADVIFIGEAEETWPEFLDDWEEGRAGRRYEQDEKTDLAKVPPPRLDQHGDEIRRDGWRVFD